MPNSKEKKENIFDKNCYSFIIYIMGCNKIKSGYGSKSCAFLSYPPFSRSIFKILVFVDDRFFLNRLRCTVARQARFTVAGRLPSLNGLKRKKNFWHSFHARFIATSLSPRNLFYLGSSKYRRRAAVFPLRQTETRSNTEKAVGVRSPMDEQDVIQLFLHTRAPFSWLGGGVPR